MYEYIQSIEENKLITQLTWSAIDKNNKKTNKTEACITNVKCHHKYHMSTMDHINHIKGLEQRGR